MEGESGVTRGFMDEFHSWDIQGDQMEGERIVLPEVSSMNLILGISKEMKGKVKVVLLEGSLMNFIFPISNEIKWKVKVALLEVSMMSSFFRYPTR